MLKTGKQRSNLTSWWYPKRGSDKEIEPVESWKLDIVQYVKCTLSPVKRIHWHLKFTTGHH